MTSGILAEAETKLLSGDVRGANGILTDVVRNPKASKHVLADAYHMLGTIAQIDPQYGDGDECGLSFFKKAIENAPNHIWANVGIISTFGSTFPDHQDRDATRRAIQVLEKVLEEIPDDVQQLIADKRVSLSDL